MIGAIPARQSLAGAIESARYHGLTRAIRQRSRLDGAVLGFVSAKNNLRPEQTPI